MREELWQQGFNPALPQKEVMPIRLRPKTKGQLVAKYKQGGKFMSPVIGTEVREGADDVTEKVPYEIINVEELTTDVQSLSGIRVSLLNQKGGEGNVMLWKRKVTGTSSKLGAYITALGSNTDMWLHKWVVHEPWQIRNNVLTVVAAPVEKPSKAKADAEADMKAADKVK